MRDDPRVTQAELRARLRSRPVFADDNESGDDTRDLHMGPAVPAAVLVPFVLGACPGILLTKRTANLSSHPGQISFPGGRVDPGDAGPEAAALREAQEEIGLDPTQVELAGRLPDYLTGSGYRITPVIGLLGDGVAMAALGLHVSPDEVDLVFEFPLAVLLDPAAPVRRTRHWRGRDRQYWEWPHPQHHIWGATAAIMVELARRLRKEG